MKFADPKNDIAFGDENHTEDWILKVKKDESKTI